jgi:uncharacterized protein
VGGPRNYKCIDTIGLSSHIDRQAFEWDEEKRQANLVKRGVDFRQMPELFDGPTVEAVDDRMNYDETRINALGEIEGRVFVVTITWRGADRRIFSARKANARERKTYYARHPR